MVYSPFAVDVVLPEDLAEQFGDIATRRAPVRSTMAALFADGTTIASTAITFLQGPPAVAYWVDLTKNWLLRKHESGVGTLRMEGPGGTVHITITEQTDLVELATALHTALFPPESTPSHDPDDIAL
ncbi:hypothetical protein [Streptomyces cyanogenus]|uniref:Uncharacterized protein n=1 Tax=Streptomyces cyanogenus TaxID=80860 RepID=A0ABX7U257_STRCY|nr:hypothetical protein [Streptomyces cyanogenus]QTE03133.1 hypothetical protein S1361_37705 [Streptomyces cyanogenus]